MNDLLFMNTILARTLAPDANEDEEKFTSSSNRTTGKKEEHAFEKLLLNGGNYTMRISQNEGVRCINVHGRKGCFKIEGWAIPVEDFEAETFDECVGMLVNKYQPSEIQIIPTRICDNDVASFMVVLVYEEK